MITQSRLIVGTLEACRIGKTMPIGGVHSEILQLASEAPMKVKYLLGSLVIGASLSVLTLVMGISFQWFAPICDVLLAPGSRLADSLPGGGMHNPLAAIAGVFTNGVIFGVLIFMVMSIMRVPRGFRHR